MVKLSGKRLLEKEENYLEKFYDILAAEDEEAMKKLHIPQSDVFYVRKAIENNTGVRYSLSHVEQIMKEEGFID